MASQTLIVGSLKSGQAISGPSFQQTHFQSQNEDFALFFSQIGGQGKKLQTFTNKFLSNILSNDFS